MRKSVFFLLAFLPLAMAAQNAQDSTTARISALSSVGISVADKAFKPTITNSTQTATGLEYRFSPRLSFIGMLGFDNFDYQKSGLGYRYSGSLRATSFDFSLRFKLATGAIQPYLKAGGGAVRFSVPTVFASPQSPLATTIENKVEVVGLVTGEAGVQFRVFGRFSLFAAGERSWAAKSDLLEGSLRVTTFKLGLISAF